MLDKLTPQDLVEALGALGFYRFVKPHRIERLKARFLKLPSLWTLTHWTKRDYPADEERLAEGGVGAFLQELAPIFKACGVKLRQTKEKCGVDGYSIVINNLVYELYSAEDVRAANEDKSLAMWEKTTQRSFALINRLLREQGSDERIYSYAGWNDHWAFILTEAMYTTLKDSALKHDVEQLILYNLAEIIDTTALL